MLRFEQRDKQAELPIDLKRKGRMISFIDSISPSKNSTGILTEKINSVQSAAELTG